MRSERVKFLLLVISSFDLRAMGVETLISSNKS